MHVLGTPPAFTLSQDQTLQFDFILFLLFTFLYGSHQVTAFVGRYLTLECSGLNTHNSLYSDFKDPDPLHRRRTCYLLSPCLSYFAATRVSIQHFLFLSTPKNFFFLKWGEISALIGLKFGAASCKAAFHKHLKKLYFSWFALIVISSIKKSIFQPFSSHQEFFF